MVGGVFMSRQRDKRPVREIAAISAHDKAVTALAFLTGDRLASASDDGTIRIWDTASKGERTTLTAQNRPVTSLAVWGDMLASAGDDGTVRIWNWKEGTEPQTLRGHSKPVKCVKFSNKGNLASGGGGFDRNGRNLPGELIIWDLTTREPRTRLTGHAGPVFALDFTPQEQILSGGNDDIVKLWDVGSGRELMAYRGHQGYVSAVANRAGPAGLVISASNDETIRFWDIGTGRERAVLPARSPICCLALIHGETEIVAGDADGSLQLWDMATGTRKATVAAHLAAVTAVAYSPELGLLASGADGTDFEGRPIRGEIKLWRLED
jgi:WD40 repeat protein